MQVHPQFQMTTYVNISKKGCKVRRKHLPSRSQGQSSHRTLQEWKRIGKPDNLSLVSVLKKELSVDTHGDIFMSHKKQAQRILSPSIFSIDLLIV